MVVHIEKIRWPRGCQVWQAADRRLTDDQAPYTEPSQTHIGRQLKGAPQPKVERRARLNPSYRWSLPYTTQSPSGLSSFPIFYGFSPPAAHTSSPPQDLVERESTGTQIRPYQDVEVSTHMRYSLHRISVAMVGKF